MTRLFLPMMLLFSMYGHAQVTITADNALALIGTSATFDFDTSEQIIVDVGLPGADQTYSMDQPYATPAATYTQMITSPDMAPNGSEFPNANLAMIVDFENDSVSADFTSYSTVDQAGWTQIGFISRLMAEGFDTVLVRTGEELFMPFPLTFGSTWNSSSADTFQVLPGSFFISSRSSDNEVDGWGKIVLPSGTFDCLRIRMNRTTGSTILFNGVPISNNTWTTIDYQWVNATHGILASITSQNGETDPNFTVAGSAARLTGATTGTVDQASVQRISIGPNPLGSRSLQVQFHLAEADPMQINLISASGRSVSRLWKGDALVGDNRFDLQIDAALPNGMYQLEIKTVSGKSVRPILLLRK